MVEKFVAHYNNIRLHSAIGYVAPVDKLNGWEQEIFRERDRKLESARELRKRKRLRLPTANPILYQKDNLTPAESLRQTARLSISN